MRGRFVSTPTVFIVDDEPVVRVSLEALISSMGFVTEAFPSATEFLAALNDLTSPGKCILADLRMPGMGGVELKKALAARNCHIPVILMTGLTTEEIDSQHASLGIFAVIQKPCHPNKLQRIIRDAIQSNAIPESEC